MTCNVFSRLSLLLAALVLSACGSIVRQLADIPVEDRAGSTANRAGATGTAGQAGASGSSPGSAAGAAGGSAAGAAAGSGSEAAVFAPLTSRVVVPLELSSRSGSGLAGGVGGQSSQGGQGGQSGQGGLGGQSGQGVQGGQGSGGSAGLAGTAGASGAAGTSASAAAMAPVPANLRTGNVIRFAFDSFDIAAEYLPLVEAHARFLSSNPRRRVMVAGHADERGGREYNLALGQKRAEAVRERLITWGVPDRQIEAVSFGEERPANDGKSEEDYAQSRRAEISYP